MKIETLKNFVSSINPETTKNELIDLLDYHFHYEKGENWINYYTKVINWLDNPEKKPPFNIFSENGNSKLSFLSFSALPVVTCPSAGNCLSWCYSYKSWGYPGAFFKQLVNTLLIWHKPKLISDELTSILKKPRFKKMEKVDFRLYVDGDIDSLNTLCFWFTVLKNNPKLQAYGYSKSLDIFMQYELMNFDFPDNYKLNVSSGGMFDSNQALKRDISRLPIYRGEFVAVPTNKRYPRKEHTSKEYRREIIKAYGKKCFICPSNCDNCTKHGHACGSDKFKNIPIVCGMH